MALHYFRVLNKIKCREGGIDIHLKEWYAKDKNITWDNSTGNSSGKKLLYQIQRKIKEKRWSYRYPEFRKGDLLRFSKRKVLVWKRWKKEKEKGKEIVPITVD